jgi:hypothetical protein
LKGKANASIQLTADDLDTLGVVLVSSFKIATISRIDLQALASRLSYFQGNCFQLNKADATAFSTIIE